MFSRIQMLDSSNVVSNCMVLFHDYCMALLMFISTYVIFMFLICYTNKKYSVFLGGASNFLEMIWTIMPMFFLLSLGIPSFLMMYFLESESKSDLTYKSISHQWYWSYESSDFNDFAFDSYMVNTMDLKDFSENRLLEVDNSLILPFNTKIRLIVTSTDVLHAWTLPSMCIKMDGVPSRLNTLNLLSLYPSSFYSQCSELCSINHSFMPIHVEFVNWEVYLKNLFM